MRNWLKTVLFASALSPTLISIAAVRFWENGFSADVAYYFLAGISGSCCSLLILRALWRNGESIKITVKKIEANDVLMLGAFASYVLPIIGKASEITVGAVAMIFAVAVIILWMSSAVLPHPVLRVFRYRFYKAESDTGVVYTLIARRELLNPQDIKQVRRISSFMLMEVT